MGAPLPLVDWQSGVFISLLHESSAVGSTRERGAHRARGIKLGINRVHKQQTAWQPRHDLSRENPLEIAALATRLPPTHSLGGARSRLHLERQRGDHRRSALVGARLLLLGDRHGEGRMADDGEAARGRDRHERAGGLEDVRACVGSGGLDLRQQDARVPAWGK